MGERLSESMREELWRAAFAIYNLDWSASQRGADYWWDVYEELIRIVKSRKP